MRKPSQNHITQESWLVFSLKKPSTPTCLHISLGHLLSTPTPRFATWGSGGTQEIQCLLFLEGDNTKCRFVSTYHICATHFMCINLFNFHNNSVIIIPML